MGKYAALATGILSEIKVLANVSGNVKVGFYSDNGGEPGNRLGKKDASTAVVAGWNTIALESPVNITDGVDYWIAVALDAVWIAYTTDAIPNRYKIITYSTFSFPDPAGSGFSAVQYPPIMHGWGVLAVSPTSIIQPISYGTPAVEVGVAEQTIEPTSIIQPISIGTPTLLYPQTLLPTSIVQAIAYGTPVLLNPQTLLPSSIIQAIAYGTSIVTRPQRYEFYLDESAYYNVYGAYWRSQTFTPQSLHKITSVKLKLCRVGSPGTGTVSIKATDVNGKPTGADLCSGSIDGNSLPTDPTLLGFSLGAGATLSVGTKYAIVWRFPSGDASNYARTRHMYTGTYTGGTAVTSSNSGATWDVVTDWDFVFEDWGESLVQTVAPESTVQPVTYGSPIVYFYGTIYPESIVQPIAYGVPTILGGIPSGIIWPESIIQPISVGSPTILKYVWHVVLDGNYITATPPTNRAFVIGRDVYGNPVYGTAVDSTELGLVGERLDFQQEPAIPTTAQAGAMADAILTKMRLTGKRGVILVPPNCGQELFDVVEVTDTKSNQAAVKFRVVGIRFEYNPKQARYQHNLILGAP